MSSVSSAAVGAGLGGAAAEAAGGGGAMHTRSFKLRFAPQREPGRSYVSLVKPFALPATVTGKFYARSECAGVCGEGGGRGVDEQLTARALQRIQDMFARGPRETHAAPLTTSHTYGWWWDKITTLEQVPRSDRRLHHHIQDSQWLKERLRVLAADDKLKQK